MPDISMCGSTECPSRDTCYRATAIRSEHQSWRDFEATRNGRERCDSYIERGFIEICTLNSEQHIVPCECGHGKDQHNSLDSRPFGKWNCTYCRCVEYDAVTDEPFSGGLGDEATQWAWMRYADEQEVPHDHESEVAMQVIESTADRPLWEKHKEQERQALIAALAERDRLDPDAPNAIAFKHDPYCDCGICQYCRGDEDKFGNPTRSKEVESIREKVLITASIECSECDDAKTENLQGGNLRTLRPEFAMIVWKYGWVVELDKVLCPNCRADAEEWRSI